MSPDTAQELLKYNTWANDRVLDAVTRLDSNRLTRVLGGSPAHAYDFLVYCDEGR